MLLLYSAVCLVLQLVFWLVPNIISGAVVFSFMGFFLGPFFAAVMLPPKISIRPISTNYACVSRASRLLRDFSRNIFNQQR